MGGGLGVGTFETDPDSQVCSKPERTIVLVGRIGNGKSATGNSIAGENKFRSKTRGKSITKECHLQKTKLSTGLVVNVIDTPGLFSASSPMEFTSREIIRCLRLAEDGIDAVLLVFTLRSRLTEEEQSTLHTLKILFGSQIVDYIIVVFTNADALDHGETLDDYLDDCPEFQEILKECDDRKVLFNNRPDISETEKEKQVQDLLNIVEQISERNNGKSYMADLSLELRENEAMFRKKQKQIEAMKGLSSKEEASELENSSYSKMLELMEAKVSNQLKESLNEVKEQLSKAEAAREAAEKRLKENQKLSADEIRKQLSESEAAREAVEKTMMENQKLSADEIRKQLSEAEAAREAAEKKMDENQKLSADEIKKLREELDKAREETAKLHQKLKEHCTIL